MACECGTEDRSLLLRRLGMQHGGKAPHAVSEHLLNFNHSTWYEGKTMNKKNKTVYSQMEVSLSWEDADN
jgi:hypothetical protein